MDPAGRVARFRVPAGVPSVIQRAAGKLVANGRAAVSAGRPWGRVTSQSLGQPSRRIRVPAGVPSVLRTLSPELAWRKSTTRGPTFTNPRIGSSAKPSEPHGSGRNLVLAG